MLHSIQRERDKDRGGQRQNYPLGGEASVHWVQKKYKLSVYPGEMAGMFPILPAEFK